MPSISKINEQLEIVSEQIEYLARKLGHRAAEEAEQTALVIERLAKAQRALIETQVIIFVESTESDLDIPTLPLFIEERDESDPE